MRSDELTDRLAQLHPQMARGDRSTDPQKLADLKRTIGRRVERALAILDLEKKDAAYRMGYADPGVVSRWCSGTERPLLDKLFALDGFEQAWMVALAERHPDMDVIFTIRVRRRA